MHLTNNKKKIRRYFITIGTSMTSVLGIDFSLNGTGLFFIDENNQTKFILFSKDKKLSSLESCVILPNILIQEDRLDWVVEKIRDIIINEDVSFICMEDHIGRYFNWMDGYGILKKFIRDFKFFNNRCSNEISTVNEKSVENSHKNWQN